MNERGTQQGSSRRTPPPASIASRTAARSVRAMAAHDIPASLRAATGKGLVGSCFALQNRRSATESVGAGAHGAYAVWPPMDAHFLAFDLGAESGRAISGRLRSGMLDVAEVCRFPNEPVREHGSLHWDILRLWTDMLRGLEALESDVRGLDSIGVDAWGCDYGLLGEGGELLGNPYHYRDARTDGVMDEVFRTIPRATIYSITGTQFL